MWNEVEQKLLQGDCAAVVQPAMNCYRTAREHHDCCEIERMKSDPGNRVAPVHYVQRKTKDVSAITTLALQFKVDPTKHKWKGDEGRDDAAPHDQLVHQPT